jgi:hypothetical protein
MPLRTMLRGTRNTLLGLAVLGALGFGTSAALAEPLRAQFYTDPEADGFCSTHYGCSTYCDRTFAPGTGGWCNLTTDCCY